VALLVAGRGNDTVEPGELQYLNSDGSLGDRVRIQGAWSEGRRRTHRPDVT
jgi:hypothetical protein